MKILIICTGNSCRSQMAEGILKSFDTRLEVFSAGTRPALHISPRAVEAMKESGIDISGNKPKHVDLFLGDPFDFVITVCDSAKETCPVFSGKVKIRLHIGFDDPADATGTAEEVIEVYRRVRDEIRERFHAVYLKQIKPLADQESSGLKEIVKEKYGKIAGQSTEQKESSCCGPVSCGGEVDNTIFRENYLKNKGYNPAADLGLDCGTPTDLAGIKAGDHEGQKSTKPPCI